jgi:hypothetical protein
MTKAEAQRRQHLNTTLQSLGFTPEECDSLRRISMTLHRWHARECGNSSEHCSWAIERDGVDADGKPFMVWHFNAPLYWQVTALRRPDSQAMYLNGSNAWKSKTEAQVVADAFNKAGQQCQVRAGHIRRTSIPDREKGAKKRLAVILKRRNDTHERIGLKGPGEFEQRAPLSTYIQTDPRGPALYILRPGDVPEGQTADCGYSRGIAVY